MKLTGRPRPTTIAVALTTLLFVAWSARFLARASMRALDGQRYFALFDDALISMRYAWNLSHGHGLVWNPGERVEGYSNLLTTLLMAVATAVFDRRVAALAIQVAGVATVLGAAALAFRLARLVSEREAEPVRRVLPPLAFVATLAWYPLAYWSFMGMETGLVTLLFLGSLVAVERWAAHGGRIALVAAPLALGLASLGRPDGILFAALVLPALAHAAVRRLGLPRARAVILGALGLVLAFPAAQLVFRIAYYGAALPNTYVLKLEGVPAATRIANGFAFLAPLHGPLLVLAAGILIGILRRPDRTGVVALGGLAALTGYQIAVGGDPWPYWRIVTPAIPLALIVFGRELLRAAASFLAPAGRAPMPAAARRAGVAIACLATAAIVGWLDRPFLLEITMERRAYQYESNRDHVNLALALDSLTTRDASVGVFWAGGIPYYTMRPAVDFLGKTDPRVARLAPDLSGAIAWAGMTTVPGHNKYDLEWSLKERRPTYAQGFAWGREDLSSWGRAQYDSVTFRGVGLRLLRGAPSVRWERARILDSPSAIP